MNVLIRGAGVAGLTTALELSRRNVSVTVVDIRPSLEGSASWFAGGMLAPWCERESADQAVFDLGRSAADLWEAALPGHVVRNGTLVVAPPRDSGELARFASRAGGGATWLDEDGIARLEPALSGRFCKALFFPGEAHLDPRAALSSLQQMLADRGVSFFFAASRDLPADGFDRAVDCTGAASVGKIGDLRGVRGEMLYLETEEINLARPVRLLHPRHPIYIVPREKNRFMVGATMIETDDAGPVTARSMMELLNAAYALHPAFGEARVAETGAGIRPAYPDNLPRVTALGDTIHVNGFYRHGFLLAPAMAGEVARRLLADTPQPERLAS